MKEDHMPIKPRRLAGAFALMFAAPALAQVPLPPSAADVQAVPAGATEGGTGFGTENSAPGPSGFDAPLARGPVAGASALANSAFMPMSLGFPFQAVGPGFGQGAGQGFGPGFGSGFGSGFGQGFGQAGVQTPEGAGRRFVISPSIAAQVLGTDNVQQTARGARSELITTLTPGLLLAVDTARLQGLLNYAPAVQVYASDASSPQVLQRFNGQFLATIVPDAVFLDVRGAANTQSATGGFTPQSAPTLGRGGLVQTIAYQISPYWLHRFGDAATVQAGYSFQSVQRSRVGDDATLPLPAGLGTFGNDRFIAHSIYGVARTGQRFGPLALEGRVVSTDYDGTGVLDNAYRRSATVEARYFITRRVALLAEGGYETQRYSGTPRFQLSEPVWSVGTRLALSPDSGLTLRYVHRGGFNSPALDSVFALGGRTRVFASYSERLTTGAQRAADFLSLTTLDALGNPVDGLSGAPAAQPFADSFLGAQGSLQRVRRASATISQAWPRDVFALTFASERQRPIATAAGANAFEQRGTSVSFTWSHALTASTTAIASLQYGRLERQGLPGSNVHGGTASLVTQLAPRLSAFAQYGLNDRGGQDGGGRALQNVVVVGLRQSF